MFTRGLLFLLLSLFVLVCFTDEAVAKPICDTDFESHDKFGLYKRLQSHDRLEVVKGQGVGGGNALKATYQGNEHGSQRIVVNYQLPKRMTEATLVYDVKFDNDFQFIRTGKLHGLGPDNKITGGNEMKPDGWSARAVWHRNKGLRTYVYCQNKEGKYGQGPDRKLDFTFQKERYYSVSLFVKLNDPVDQANGVMRIYINGTGIADHTGIQFRSVGGDKTKISQLLFSTFHGGNKPSDAPKNKDGSYTNVHAYFDNFAVYEGLHVRNQPGQ